MNDDPGVNKLYARPDTTPAEDPPTEDQVILALREPIVYMVDRTHRNKPCRCGSGVKFKRCCRGKVVRV